MLWAHLCSDQQEQSVEGGTGNGGLEGIYNLEHRQDSLTVCFYRTTYSPHGEGVMEQCAMGEMLHIII